jgi:hypothetical protein
MGHSGGSFSFSSSAERRKKIHDDLVLLKKQERWSFAKLQEESGLSRKALAGLLHRDGDTSARISTLDRAEEFLATRQSQGGFVDKSTYIAIARGMGGSQDNARFIRDYGGEYRVIRAHVPSRRALVSTLFIIGDPDNLVIRYEHIHVVSDTASLFAHRKGISGSEPSPNTLLGYKGFVFNSQKRAILLSTSLRVGHVKEMIINMPAIQNPPDAFLRGLVLTVSPHEGEPFAARIMVEKLPRDLTPEELEPWRPGLKNWKEMPEQAQREFNETNNFGLLFLHSRLI